MPPPCTLCHPEWTCRLMKTFYCLFIVLILNAPAFAQEVRLAPGSRSLTGPAAEPEAAEGPGVIHVTDRINNTPEAREALGRFQEAKAAGTLSLGKTTREYQVGQTATFNVIENINHETDYRWVAKQFELKARTEPTDPAAINLWVETGELAAGRITDEKVAALREALVFRSGATSIDPNKGIIANNYAVFGNPPDMDGDGRLDVLLYDITEGDGEDCCVLGYVSGTDLNPNPRIGEGNKADILYLDTRPGSRAISVDELLWVAAHEHQHLVHFNYDLTEISFVNEGLSEWASAINGYPGRAITYLNQATEHPLTLMRWGEGINNYDYERAGLFTGYFAERFGVEKTGSIARTTTTRGANAYRNVLATITGAPTLDKLVLDFHTANRFGAFNLDPRFAYLSPVYANLSSVPTLYVDGSLLASTPRTIISIEPGGVEYLVWDNVTDLKLKFDTQTGTGRSSVRARVVLQRRDGTKEWKDITPSAADQVFPGSYERVTLIATYITFELSSPISLAYSASWTNDGGAFERETISYDDGFAAADTVGTTVYIEAYSIGSTGMQANRFVVPEGAILDKVQVAPYYENHFDSKIPSSAPRDLRLVVWSHRNRLPADELFSLNVTDPRVNSRATFVFNSIDLSGYRNELSNLPDTVYIGFANVGADTNFVMMGVSEYSGAPARRGWCRQPPSSAGAPLRERTIEQGTLTAPTSAGEEAA